MWNYQYNEKITLDLKGEPNKEILIVADDKENLPIFDFKYKPYGSNSDSDCNGIRAFGDSEIITRIINSGWLFQPLIVNVLTKLEH